uniref:Uncharacterized protein n=1 Tax=Siphoviridae sp. ctwQT14 TaxID=2827971 RepID=A0A8S5TKI0_9CAUD|nr:MAG TPA: hypothetical protein [Siphoviridae sp. ctwQT14]
MLCRLNPPPFKLRAERLFFSAFIMYQGFLHKVLQV